MACSRWTLPTPRSDIVLYLCWRHELTRQAQSGNRCRSGKAISRPITYFECVFVALGISMQTAWAVSYCHMWPVSLYHVSLHYTWHDFLENEKENLLNIKCVLIPSTCFIRNISDSKKISTRYYDKCTLVFTWSTCHSSDFDVTLIL